MATNLARGESRQTSPPAARIKSWPSATFASTATPQAELSRRSLPARWQRVVLRVAATPNIAKTEPVIRLDAAAGRRAGSVFNEWSELDAQKPAAYGDAARI